MPTRSIKTAKAVKETIQKHCDANWPNNKAEVRVVIHENDLAIQITFARKTQTPEPLPKIHEGFPLLVKYP